MTEPVGGAPVAPSSDRTSDLRHIGAVASVGAGVLHAVAAGLHVDHEELLRVFVTLAALQVAWGVAVLAGSSRRLRLAGVAISGLAVAGWLATRTTGVSFIDGLEVAESPGPADTVAAVLALVALVSVSVPAVAQRKWRLQGWSVGLGTACMIVAATGAALTVSPHPHGTLELTASDLFIDDDGVIVTPGAASAATATATSAPSATPSTSETVAGAATPTSVGVTTAPRKTTTTTVPATTTTIHHDLTSAQAKALASGWPRAFDPSKPVDFSGIEGVTPEQAARASALIANAARDLARYASYEAALADGYLSIGDSGFEHVIKYQYLNDGRFLDTKAPESLVYKVEGATKTLVSAMFIANPGTAVSDATINDYAGGLIQWHVHDNLCWRLVGGVPKVAGVLDATGACPPGSTLNRGGSPMVHVWVTAHPCGPFAAVEGVAAGISDVPDSKRVDLCQAAH